MDFLVREAGRGGKIIYLKGAKIIDLEDAKIIYLEGAKKTNTPLDAARCSRSRLAVTRDKRSGVECIDTHTRVSAQMAFCRHRVQLINPLRVPIKR